MIGRLQWWSGLCQNHHHSDDSALDDPSSEIVTSLELEEIHLFLFLPVSTWRDERIQCLKRICVFLADVFSHCHLKAPEKCHKCLQVCFKSAGTVRISICFKRFEVLKEEGRYLQLNEEKWNFGQHLNKLIYSEETRNILTDWLVFNCDESIYELVGNIFCRDAVNLQVNLDDPWQEPTWLKN